jgi:cephalosporin-C deacetylase-like acetyl esterase
VIVANTEDVTFFSGHGLRLSGRLYLPDRTANRHAGIVFCHGFGGVKDGTPPGLSDLLAQHGYTVLTFDYRGFGGSEGRANHIVPTEQVEDAVNAVEYLAQKQNLGLRTMGIYGNSFGGGLAIMAANRSERLRAGFVTVPVTSGDRWLRSINRYYEYQEMKSRAYRAIAEKTVTGEMEMVDRFELVVPDPHSRAYHVNKQSFTCETFFHVSHHDPLAEADKLTIPLGIIGIRGDLLVPFEQATSLYERVKGPKEIHVFDKGNHHSVYGDLLADVAKIVIPFFDRHLCGDSAPAT